jgi:hypothetical protein
MTINVNKAYKTRICKLSGIKPNEFEYYYKTAFQRLNCDPTDVALIVKTIKYMVRRDKLKGPGE